MTAIPKKLTNAQVALLELFDVNMSDQEIDELKRMLMQHFRGRLEAEVDRVIASKGKTIAQLEKEMNFDSRTERLRTIRQGKP